MKIILMDKAGSYIASGDLAVNVAQILLEGPHILIRNKRYYYFNSYVDGLAYFAECDQPYIITEF